ncbi:MAG TPA: 5-formyltetrahydrofolate cyclo-ligase [Cyclobacteriaceae bacterium]|nr:5-formyltetrahydrofolate cyclo-ligase [Cyclobacteriaceae bacterium]
MTKAEARTLFLNKRKALSDAQRDVLNLNIYHRFFASGYLDLIHNLHIFLSMERTREPDTWQLIDRIRREMPNIRMIIPRVNEGGSLDHIYFEGLHQLKQSSLGILEPSEGVPANVNKIDMVIVPLVAVDVEGNRVGYGKGYYDKFLKECRPDCKKAGISFFGPSPKLSDVEDHDVPLDACFTPDGVLFFNT